jgi:hypothetical protein
MKREALPELVAAAASLKLFLVETFLSSFLEGENGYSFRGLASQFRWLLG